MQAYKPWDFCKSLQCYSHQLDPEYCKKVGCKAYQMHDYLREHGQIIEEGNPLLAELEQLRRVRDAAEKLNINQNALYIYHGLECECWRCVIMRNLEQALSQAKAGDN